MLCEPPIFGGNQIHQFGINTENALFEISFIFIPVFSLTGLLFEYYNHQLIVAHKIVI